MLKKIFLRSLQGRLFSIRRFHGEVKTTLPSVEVDARELETIHTSSELKTRHIESDIFVVGSGIVGTSFACAVAQSPFTKKVVMIDPQVLPKIETYTKAEEGENRIPEPRVYTLTPSSLRFFRSLDLFSITNNQYITPFMEMMVYEHKGTSYLRFSNQESSDCYFVKAQEFLTKNLKKYTYEDEKEMARMKQDMGATIENNHLQAALLTRFDQFGNKCETIATKLKDFKIPSSAGEMVEGELEDGTTFRTKLLVGSDGASSQVRKVCKIGAWGYGYNQNGIVCTVKLNYPTNSAFQRFLDSGPVAILPLWGNYASIVWSVGMTRSQELMSMSSEQFIQELNNAFQQHSLYETSNESQKPPLSKLFDSPSNYFSHLGNYVNNSVFKNEQTRPPYIVSLETSRFKFPLNLQHSDSYAQDRIALIGDAAHSVHPLAGQGLNLGITDAALLANTVVRAQKSGEDYGNMRFLEDFASKSKSNAYMMSGTIEFVKNSYDDRLPSLLTHGRNAAISLIQNTNLIKYNINNFASGDFNHPRRYEWLNV